MDVVEDLADDGGIRHISDHAARQSETIGDQLRIRYRDSRGEVTDRRVQVKKMAEGRAGVVLHAFCAERMAIRAFKIDRIIEAEDLQTGEVLTDSAEIQTRVGRTLGWTSSAGVSDQVAVSDAPDSRRGGALAYGGWFLFLLAVVAMMFM